MVRPLGLEPSLFQGKSLVPHQLGVRRMSSARPCGWGGPGATWSLRGRPGHSRRGGARTPYAKRRLVYSQLRILIRVSPMWGTRQSPNAWHLFGCPEGQPQAAPNSFRLLVGDLGCQCSIGPPVVVLSRDGGSRTPAGGFGSRSAAVTLHPQGGPWPSLAPCPSYSGLMGATSERRAVRVGWHCTLARTSP